jgi:hypothetical protein
LAALADAFVGDEGAFAAVRAGPVPDAEAFLQGLAAEVGIEVGAPCHDRAGACIATSIRARGARQCQWCRPCGSSAKARVERFCDDAHAARHATLPGHAHALVQLLDFDFQGIAGPVHAAGADQQGIGIALHRAARALGHRPARAGSIERDVERAVIERIAPAAFLVIGENTLPMKAMMVSPWRPHWLIASTYHQP